MRRVAGGRLALLAMAAVGLFSGGCTWFGSGTPRGWHLATDPTGSCQVATPPDWRAGREFFLKKEPAEIRQTAQGKQAFPPRGFALWENGSLPKPAGDARRFQLRHAQVRGEEVCSVWRIKVGASFTPEETSLADQVGQTLRWVR